MSYSPLTGLVYLPVIENCAVFTNYGVKAKKKRTGHAEDDFPMELHGAPQPSHPEKQPETAYQYERQGE